MGLHQVADAVGLHDEDVSGSEHFLSIELDPADGGTRGPIILTAVDSDAHQLIAWSFTELLSVYFEGLQNGDVEVGAQDD